MKNSEKLKSKLRKVPSCPGVYLFYDKDSRLLYIGKAINLRRRISSYFRSPHSDKISQMVARIAFWRIRKTKSNIEALILESLLIKKHQPLYNSLLKDDKSFAGVFITKEPFPKVFSARVTSQLPAGEWFGPYVRAGDLRVALKVLRKIFKWCSDPDNPQRRPCFYYHLGLCSGACVGALAQREYKKAITHLKNFLRGKRASVIRSITSQMKSAGKSQEFERAKRLRDMKFALEHIRESALVVAGGESAVKPITHLRIEGYDVANLGNSDIAGAMVVFGQGQFKRDDYRKFRIRALQKANDVGAIREIIARRLKHRDWALPALVLVDGGVAQVNGAKRELHRAGCPIAVVGLAKGPKRDKNQLVGDVSFVTNNKIPLSTLIKLRDEAHRFARKYYFFLRRKTLLGS